MTDATRLNRRAYGERAGIDVPASPVRIVHLGLGAFHRAHQAWYTDRADELGEWGIAAFTGRSRAAADELEPQDGLYTLIQRADDGDEFTVIRSISEAVDGADLDRLAALLADPAVAIVTLTITEAGYRLDADGRADFNDQATAADLEALAGASVSGYAASPTTALGRLVLGLDARRRAGAGPIAVVPCDNIPGNGALVRGAVLEFAERVNGELADWVRDSVSFVSTSVDRITPRTTSDDRDLVARSTGWLDAGPVVTEPFSDWILSGEFPAGRPDWERAGARFVDDIEPFERRKLWLLNGAHSLLAYAGLLRGYHTVSEAIADPECLAWVNELWDEDARHLPEGLLDLPSYRAALLDRFGNARIAHRLEQIGMDGVAKLRVRIPPVILAERSAGRRRSAAIRVLSAWAAVVLSGRAIPDTQSDALGRIQARGGDLDDQIRELVRLVDARLTDPDILGDIVAQTEHIAAEAADVVDLVDVVDQHPEPPDAEPH